jgi:hypothetical protein
VSSTQSESPLALIPLARGSVVNSDTILEAGKSWVRFPMRSLNFSD